MKHVKLFEQFITEKQSVLAVTGLSKEAQQKLIDMGHSVKIVGPGYYVTVDDSEKKRVIDYIRGEGAEVNESNDVREDALESIVNESADFTLDNIKKIIKASEHYSDGDFKITLDNKEGIIHISPKGNRRLVKSLSELEKLFDVKTRAEEIDDERGDFYEYFVKAKGTNSKVWNSLD